MKPLVIIPARMASTRLPGKPLADIGGEPMVVRVWRRAVAARLGRVLVAAAEPEIVDAVTRAGGRALLTDPALPSGSDRVKQAADLADPARDCAVVVNLQGDLPTLDPAVLVAARDALAAGTADLATAVAEIRDEREKGDPGVVKAVVSWGREGAPGRALYFSRAAAPWGDGPLWHHIGLYAWRRAALDRFVALPPSPLERREGLEQLRALEAGMTVAVARVDSVPIGVDTPGDLERARALFAET